MKPYPQLKMVEPLKSGFLRLSFAVGKFIEVKEVYIPGPTSNARIIDYGMGLRVSDSVEYSAPALYERPGEWLRRRPHA